jgi:hypothetical protein
MSAADGPMKEHWIELCDLCRIEKDPKKLAALLEEIHRLLEERERRMHPAA